MLQPYWNRSGSSWGVNSTHPPLGKWIKKHSWYVAKGTIHNLHVKVSDAVFVPLWLTQLLIAICLWKEAFITTESHLGKSASQEAEMSRPKRPVNGRISVHTFDIVDELLDDNNKHELAKVRKKSFKAVSFPPSVYIWGEITGPCFKFSKWTTIISNLQACLIAGLSQASSVSSRSWANEVPGLFGTKSC